MESKLEHIVKSKHGKGSKRQEKGKRRRYPLRADPPLTRRLSVHATVMMLGYLGFSDEVYPLMRILSKKASNFLKKHPVYMKRYVSDFLPKTYFTKPLNGALFYKMRNKTRTFIQFTDEQVLQL